jgi:predicted RNA-binding protein with PUA-like domain
LLRLRGCRECDDSRRKQNDLFHRALPHFAGRNFPVIVVRNFAQSWAASQRRYRVAYWLMKSEPDVFSWDDLVGKGATGEPWNGVRNHTAKLNLMKMKKGERFFFYHSNIGKEVVGIGEIIRDHYPDPTAEAGSPWVVTDVIAQTPLAKPVTMADVKTVPKLKDMALLKYSRLSVQPVTAEEWKIVCRMGGVSA